MRAHCEARNALMTSLAASIRKGFGSKSTRLQGVSVGSSARVRRQRRNALAAVQRSRKVREPVFVALGLLLALREAAYPVSK